MSEEQRAEAAVEDWLEDLRDNGYRLTAPRKVVVQVIAEAQRALSPTEIYERARRHHPRLGLVTVYRTMEKLEELGLVQRVHRPDGCQAFIAGASGHQHLLVCENCGRVEYFSGDDMGLLIRQVERQSGYEVHDHWLQFLGLCRRCRRE